MKTRVLFFLGFLLALLAPAKAQTVLLTMVGSNPTFNDDGSLASAPVQGMFQVIVKMADKAYYRQDSITWDGASDKSTITLTVSAITVAGKDYSNVSVTVPYSVVTNMASAIAYFEQSRVQGTQAKAAIDKAAADEAARLAADAEAKAAAVAHP